jgi:hypothetical protein
LNGTIQGQNISSAEIPLYDAEDKQKLSFPDTTGSTARPDSEDTTSIGSKIKGRIS